jgi:hypothetical protein
MADADTNTSEIKEIEVDGYKFTVDTDKLDDVEALDFIERIENKGQVAAVLPLLKFMLDDTEYEQMRKAFIEIDAKEHKDKNPNSKNAYHPRFRINKLNAVYLAIIEKFNPKD